MAKRKVIRKSNKLFTIKYPNHYDWGGDLKNAFKSSLNLKDTFNGNNMVNIIGGLANGLGGTAGSLIGGGLESGAGNTIGKVGSAVGSVVGAANPLLGGLISAGSGIISGITNALFGSKINQDKVNEIEASNKNLDSLMVDSSSNDSILDQWSSRDFGQNFTKSDIGRDGLFSNKAQNKYIDLQNRQNAARNRALTAFENAINSLDTQSDLNIMANYSSYGGPLYTVEDIISIPEDIDIFDKGGKIHIKEANKGKFTKYCGGKVTSECIARGKRSKSAAVRKRATFAANARKWHHAFGGYLYDEGGNLYTSVPNIGQHGGDFSNGVTIIDNGGTHEENPMEGVPMGIAPDGTPNLVEQGEVKFNDYIFSNRLFASKDLLEDYRLPVSYENHSFAAIAEKLSKESSERPNDPISRRGLIDSMTKLQQAQEQIRMKDKNNNKYAKGGRIGMLYSGNGPYPNLLDSLNSPKGLTEVEPIQISDLDLPSYDSTLFSSPKVDRRSGPTWLRYAPVVGSGLSVLTDAIGLTNKPNYYNSDLIGRTVDNLTKISAKPIGNYLTYRPLDRNYYINKLNAQSGATRRAIVDQSGGNRATATAGLLAADYNALNSLGELARKSEEYNLAQRERVEAFNRGTNQFNSEMALKAAMANRDIDKIRLQARMAQAQLRAQEEARASAGRSANLTNFFDSLGEIGREEFSRNMINSNSTMYYSIDSKGRITYKNGFDNLSEVEKNSIRREAEREAERRRKKDRGGYLTIRGGK